MLRSIFSCCYGTSRDATPSTRTPLRQSQAEASKVASTRPPKRHVTSPPTASTSASQKPRSRADMVDSASLEDSAMSSDDASSSIVSSASASASATESLPLPCKGTNYLFYQNRIPSKPNPGGLIDHIHERWFGSYHLLETHHGYIQVRPFLPHFLYFSPLYISLFANAVEFLGFFNFSVALPCFRVCRHVMEF